MIIYMHISNFLRKSEKYKRDVLHMHDLVSFHFTCFRSQVNLSISS